MINDSEKHHQEDTDWVLIDYDLEEEESSEGMKLDTDMNLLSPESDTETNTLYPESDDENNTPSPELHNVNRYKLISSGSSSLFTHQLPQDYTNFPQLIKLKEDKAIKDVVRELALPYLPAKSLCRFRTVSKEWHQWLTSPFLAHKQSTQFKEISGLFCQFPGEDPSFISLDRYAYGVPNPSLNFLPAVEIRTSCNGLLCCQGRYGDKCYFICNPSIQEWRMLPESILYHGPETSIALAFQPDALNFAACFELICVVPSLDAPVLQFEIYSSRTSTWRVSQKLCCELDGMTVTGDGCYFNGFVYWQTESSGILAFDVKNEEYGFISFPPRSGPTGTLAEAHGELCYLMPNMLEFRIEVYGGLTMTLMYVIELHPRLLGEMEEPFRALSLVNDDIIVIGVGNKVISYNLRNQEFKRLSYQWSHNGFPKYLPYVNSLVPVSHPLIRGLR